MHDRKTKNIFVAATALHKCAWSHFNKGCDVNKQKVRKGWRVSAVEESYLINPQQHWMVVDILDCNLEFVRDLSSGVRLVDLTLKAKSLSHLGEFKLAIDAYKKIKLEAPSSIHDQKHVIELADAMIKSLSERLSIES